MLPGSRITNLIFNVVYTPGTTHLAFLATSLLNWPDVSLRLVANHCPEEEQRYLREICRRNPRLEFYALPDTGRMVHHEIALNHLQTLETSEKFCFLDSDIFANGPFLPHFRPLWKNYAGVFAGAPVWCLFEEQTLPDESDIMAGEYHRAADGRCLGGTYFAIYDNALLMDFRREHGFLFERGYWRHLSVSLQKQLSGLGLVKDFYDTGKLLNIFLSEQGERLIFRDTETLCHLGGVSYVRLKRARAAEERAHKITTLWRQPWHFGPLLYRRARRGLQMRLRPGVFDKAGKLPFSRRRDLYSFYFADVLDALREGAELPSLPKCGVPEIERRISIAARQLTENYRFSEFQVDAAMPANGGPTA